MKIYFIKMSELRDRFTAAHKAGKEAFVLNSLVRPSCLIIDEVGHCDFDKENTRLFFGLIDWRYNKEGNFNIVFTNNKNPALWRAILARTTLSYARLTASLMRQTFNIKGKSFRDKKLKTVALKISKVKAATPAD